MTPGLEMTATYEPPDSGGVFSYGVHAAVVAADPETGVVEILQYAVAEDCGTMINPMIVDGQIIGGIAQGIGTALYEESPYDTAGEPLATTFGDYMMPVRAGNSADRDQAFRFARATTPSMASRAWAKAAPSLRRRRLPTRCRMRSATSAPGSARPR